MEVFFYFQNSIFDILSIILLISTKKHQVIKPNPEKSIRKTSESNMNKSINRSLNKSHEAKTQINSHNEWKAMVNEFPIGVIIISKEKSVLFSNKSVQKMFEIQKMEQPNLINSPEIHRKNFTSSIKIGGKSPSIKESTINDDFKINAMNFSTKKFEVDFSDLDSKIGKLEEVQAPKPMDLENPINNEKIHSFSSSNELTIYSHKSHVSKPQYFYHYNSVNPSYNKGSNSNFSPKNTRNSKGTSHSAISSIPLFDKEKKSEKVYKKIEKTSSFVPIRKMRGKFNTEKVISFKEKEERASLNYNKTMKVDVKNKNKNLTLDLIISAMIIKRQCPHNELESNISFEKDVKTYCTQYKNFNSNENKKKKYEIKIQTILYKDQESFLILIEDVSYRDSIAQLRENNDYKNKIMTTLSHEIRTPLNGAIPGLEDIYSNLEEENPLKNQLAVPLKSLYLLQNVLGDAVDFALINSNQLYLNYEESNFFEFMKETVEIFSMQAELKNIEISFNFADRRLPPKKLIADFQRIKQILVSLIGNSLKNTNGGFIDVTIEVASCKKKNQKKESLRSPKFKFVNKKEVENEQEKIVLKFIVEDNGFGIESQKLEVIQSCLKEKNPLEVCNNLNKESGCGLGLTISHCLALILGPKSNKGLEIESQLNEGTKTEFYIEFLVDKKAHENFVNALSTIRETKEITRYSTKRKDGIPNQNLGMSMISRTSKFTKTSKDEKTNPFLESSSSKITKLKRYNSQNLKKEEEKEEYRFQKSLSLNDSPRNPIKLFANNKMLEPSNMSIALESIHVQEYQNSHQFVTNFDLMFSPSRKPKNCQEKTFLSAISKSTYSHHFDELLKSANCQCEEALIVDDDAFNLKSLELMLGKFGKKCVKAYNGEEAIRIIQEKYQTGLCCRHCKAFSIIFMDYHMPIKDGVETTKFLKGLMDLKELPTIPIIACTAFGAKDLVEKWQKAGMTEFITKPITLRKIGGILEKFCVL